MRSPQRAPVAVRAARTTWFVAIGAGVFETALVLAGGRTGGGAVVGVAVRAAVFAVAVLVVLRMSAGRRWAGATLTVALGLLGTASLTADPLLRLLRGNSLPELVGRWGVIDVLFAGSRALHVVAVLGACVLMFLPSADRYFRTPAAHLARGRGPVEMRS